MRREDRSSISSEPLAELGRKWERDATSSLPSFIGAVPLFVPLRPFLRSLIATQEASGFFLLLRHCRQLSADLGVERLGSQRSGRHGEVKPAAAFGGGSKSQA